MKADKKQQLVYDFLMLNIRLVIYNENTFEHLIKKLKASEGDPSKMIAHTAAMVTKSVVLGLEGESGPVPKVLIGPALAEAVAELSLLAERNDVLSKGQAKDVAKKALPQAVKFYASTKQMQSGGAPPGAPPEAPAQPPPQQGLVNQAMEAA